MMRDFANELLTGISLPPTTVTTDADATGAAVDLSNGMVASAALLEVNAVSGAGASLSLKIQSNTTSATTGFTDITGATFTAVTTSGARQRITFLVPAGHRYVRCVGAVVGTTPSLVAMVEIVSSKKSMAASGAESGVSRSPSS